VRWLLLFGGIVLFAVVLYACIGVWLWRRAKELFAELGQAADKLDRAMAEREERELAHADPAETGGVHRR
jgi:hypothetical protein